MSAEGTDRVRMQPERAPVTSSDRVAALFSLANRVAVVTDSGLASSQQIAELLASAGAFVIIADVELSLAQVLAERLSAINDGRVVAVATNVEEEQSVIELFRWVKARYGRADILVNCAGAAFKGNPKFTEMSVEQWDKLNSLNLRSNFLCMREAVKVMLAAGNGGRIVNITTIGALSPVLMGNEAYSAARAGVTMLTKTTALDYAGDGIRVNVVMPGAINTKLRRVIETGLPANNGPILDGPHRLPLGMGTLVDVAAAVLFLVSPAGAYITGQTLVLDGGFLLT